MLEIILLILTILLICIIGKQAWNRPKIPGPFSLPFLGTGWIYSSLGGYSFNKLHESYAALFKKYGNIVREETLFNVKIISVKDKSDIEKVFKSSGKYPIRPPTEAILLYRRSRPDRYASGGIVNEQGPTWYNLRFHLTTEITSTQTIANFVPQIDLIISDWCDAIKQNNGGVIRDLKPLAVKLGLEISCALMLDRRMGFFLPDGFTGKALELYETVQHHFVASRDTYYGLPFWKLWTTPAYHRLKLSEDKMYTLVLELIESSETTLDSNIMQSILNATQLDIRERNAAIVDFIAAGIYTIANTVIFLLHLIGKNQECQRKLHEDIANGSTKYLKACINENFRLIPTAFCIARITEQNLELSGYEVKAGSVVLCHTGLACKNDDNFQDAERFVPERWLGKNKKKNMATATYLLAPFGIGRRICPGRRLIEQVLCSLLVGVIQQFEIFSPERLELEFEFILAPKAPVKMHFRDRAGS